VNNRQQQLLDGAALLQLSMSPGQALQLLALADELLVWNQQFNLTAIKQPEQVLTHHLLDSLTAQPALQGERIADVGTGAGFPGLPLAILNPQRQITLIDSVAKKLRFVEHMVLQLQLVNVQVQHVRAEAWQGAAFDTVLTRAVAPLPRQLGWMQSLCNTRSRVVAMKGRWPPAPDSEDAGALPHGWRIESVQRVTVPGLEAERHLIIATRSTTGR
jgi:16S rRNA (guanine527-N7)-methyltransferase